MVFESISPELLIKRLSKASPNLFGMRGLSIPPDIKLSGKLSESFSIFYEDSREPDLSYLGDGLIEPVLDGITHLCAHLEKENQISLSGELLAMLWENASINWGKGPVHAFMQVRWDRGLDLPLVDTLIHTPSVQATYGLMGIRKLWANFLMLLEHRGSYTSFGLGDVYLRTSWAYVRDDDLIAYYSKPLHSALF